MKHLVILSLALLISGVNGDEAPPTYKGLVCVGWTKPEAQAITDGDSPGEKLVVNTPLTASEKKQLYYARQETSAVIHKENAVESSILAHHHLLFPLSSGSDWMRQGPCGDTPMIRSDEYHITQFVPSNPHYPGDHNWVMESVYHSDPEKCRSYFSEMRKHAVTAMYGAAASDKYIP